jgi:putative tryptophan/tyrosine transport system substrate-binding protein
MRRRQFITLLGGAAVAWPLAARAQQAANKVYRVGFLTAGAAFRPKNWSIFVDGLHELGWIEGKNIVFERRYAENNLDRLPELAAELVRLDVDAIVTFGTLAPLAAKRATTIVPIVMANAGDPLWSGLVASLARPDGNVTGMSLMAPDLGGKRLELLKEVLPRLSRVAVVWNAANPYSALVFKETRGAARTLTIEIESLEVRGPGRLRWRTQHRDATTRGCFGRRRRPTHLRLSEADCRILRYQSFARDLRPAGVCRRRGPHGVWGEPG